MDIRSLPRNLAALAAISSLTMLTGCFGPSGPQYSYQNITLTISPEVTSIPVNSSVTFTSTTANAPNNPEWILLSYAYANLGSPPTANGSTYVYTAPPTPPIYTGAGSSNNTQGSVTLQAGVFGDNFNEITAAQTFVITAPSITAGIAPASATVPLSSTLQLNAYAVGSTNNGVSLQVNGVPGGNASTGTLSTANQFPQHYVYTAPATMPMSGSIVTITVTSQADPTKTASALLTLQ